jgi:hypothetical protein
VQLQGKEFAGKFKDLYSGEKTSLNAGAVMNCLRGGYKVFYK